MLTFHHTAEDRHVFPALMQGSEGLSKVVERLAAEHEIIHRLLEHLEERAMAIISDPGGENFVRLKEIFELLERVVKSHFGYEQAELEEAIGYWNVPL
jgi:hemerythrin-like domain-containing protein